MIVKSAAVLALTVAGTCVAVACGASGDESENTGPISQACTVQAPTACPDPPVVYADVEPILARQCVTCHDTEPGGPWPLASYRHAADWQADIRDVVAACTMPPVDAGATMSDEERVALLTWVRCGAKQTAE